MRCPTVRSLRWQRRLRRVEAVLCRHAVHLQQLKESARATAGPRCNSSNLDPLGEHIQHVARELEPASKVRTSGGKSCRDGLVGVGREPSYVTQEGDQISFGSPPILDSPEIIDCLAQALGVRAVGFTSSLSRSIGQLFQRCIREMSYTSLPTHAVSWNFSDILEGDDGLRFCNDLRLGAWSKAPELHHVSDFVGQTMGPGVAFADGSFYVAGGQPLSEPHARFTNRLWRFTPRCGSAVDLPSMPMARKDCVVVVERGKLYILGGWGHGSDTADSRDSLSRTRLAQASCLDLSTQTWEELPPMPCLGCGVAVAGAGFLFADCYNDHRAQIMSFELIGQRWTVLPPMPTPRILFGMSVVGRRVYTVGGEDSSGMESFDSVECFDLAMSAWSILQPLRYARSRCLISVACHHMYVLGGRDQIYGSREHESVEIYDLAHHALESSRQGEQVIALVGMWEHLPAASEVRFGCHCVAFL